MPFKQDDYFQCYIVLFLTRCFVNKLLVDEKMLQGIRNHRCSFRTIIEFVGLRLRTLEIGGKQRYQSINE